MATLSLETANFLTDYKGNFNFLLSVQKQFLAGRILSEKQVAAVEKCMKREQKPVSTENQEPTLSGEFQVGDIINIGNWIAKRLTKDLDLDVFFRNLQISEIHNETKKALQVTVKFHSQVASSCHCCNRELTCDISKSIGIGPVCAKYVGISRPTLQDAKKALEQVAQYAEKIGPLKVWLPKSQIKEVKKPQDSMVDTITA